MKKLLYSFAAVALLLSIGSCTKDPIAVKYGVTDTQVCLNANPFYGPEQYYVIDINKSEVVTALANVGITYDPARIKSAKLENAELVVVTSGVSLDLVSNAALYVRDTQTGVNGTNKGTQIAYTENIAPGAAATALKLNGTEMREYALKDNFQLVIEVLNADKTSTGGTPAFCLKLSNTRITYSVKQ
ncbi:MAG: hypothetical protein JNK66_09425 [Chitinophagales bacterium]|nr:hypothetical protein [Chitinophagales bacterium]